MKQFKGKCINSNVTDAKLADLPKYDTLMVGERKVVVGGFLTTDTSLYAPSLRPTVLPPAVRRPESNWAGDPRIPGRPPLTECGVFRMETVVLEPRER
jgi:hypothetical protein